MSRPVPLLTLLSTLATSAALASEAVQVVGGLELPPVPRAVLAAVRTGGTEPTPEPGRGDAPETLRVRPGVNEIVPVAIGHLNRIVTPFEHPRVRTVSTATTEVEGRAVYVAPATEEPVALFLTSAEDEDLALSLTLAPRRIPPRELRLALDGGTQATPAVATRWEQAQPYAETLTRALRALALGEVPAGYGLRGPRRGESAGCAQGGLAVRIGQVLEGHALWLVAARAENVSAEWVTLDESRCEASVSEAVLAVAAWPRVELAPGDATELYLAVRPRGAEAAPRARPPLVDGPRRP
jgi:conjugal transfer pilus assembly protein TraK